MTLKFDTNVKKRLKIKVTKFLGLTPTVLEITGEKISGGGGGFFILNRVKFAFVWFSNNGFSVTNSNPEPLSSVY